MLSNRKAVQFGLQSCSGLRDNGYCPALGRDNVNCPALGRDNGNCPALGPDNTHCPGFGIMKDSTVIVPRVGQWHYRPLYIIM